MSPRPQTRTDAELLDGAEQTISRIGIVRLTLGRVARLLRISPGTLVHRFGTKRGLLLALVRRSLARADERLATHRAGYDSPLAALLGLGDRVARRWPSAEGLINSLGFLQAALSDPEFHELAAERMQSLRSGISGLIREAIDAGELQPCDSDQVARAVLATIVGSLPQWAIEQHGTLAARIRANLSAVLEPLERGDRRREAR